MIFEVENKKVFSSDIGQTFDKNKHSIILLHGSGQSHVVWSLTDQYLADEGFNVFALDLPGHGNSEGSSLKSIEEMADWLNKVVNVIGIKDLTILGHSQGCLVAIEYANKFPDNIKNLIFVAGSYQIPVNKSLILLSKKTPKIVAYITNLLIALSRSLIDLSFFDINYSLNHALLNKLSKRYKLNLINEFSLYFLKLNETLTLTVQL